MNTRPSENAGVANLIVELVDGEDLPIHIGGDDRDRAVLADQPHLAVGADR